MRKKLLVPVAVLLICAVVLFAATMAVRRKRKKG